MRVLIVDDSRSMRMILERLVFEALEAGADEDAMKPVIREVIEDELQLLGLS